MKLMPVLAALLLVAACSPPGPVPPAPPATARATAKDAPEPEPQPPPSSANPFDPAELAKHAEPLPELPKADPKSQVKALLPDKTLYLETLPDKSRRVLLVAEVCLREGPLEVLLCKNGTKEHESIIRTAVDARYIHAALIRAGAKPGSPVQFVNPKTNMEDYKPATGTEIKVLVHYKMDGKLHTHPAQEWIADQMTKKPMAHRWVFAGSRLLNNPDRPNDPPYYTANNGEVISISNFLDSMLEIPVAIGQDNASLNFFAEMGKIPPLLSKVWVILEPVAPKK
ncbi:MAG TPA: YdjY domain-containing protein [Fimbriiglobus sp.]|nr:YdjY domain-containing protein [Fimbriiglobus sp.]